MNRADLARPKGKVTLDLAALLQHAFISGRESAGGSSSYHGQMWAEYDPAECKAWSRILSALEGGE